MKQNSKNLTVNLIVGFVLKYLINQYDTPVSIAEFHKEIWKLVLECIYGNKTNKIGIAAPRKHAKSTSVTHALTLALFLFKVKKYGLIVSDTEGQASQFLGNIKAELMENEGLRRDFGIKRLLKDAVTDIIVELQDGSQFRLSAYGAEQKVRGRIWRGTRPDYIIGDDLENDELVENDDRRPKFRNWFYKSLVPVLSKSGIIVVVGTILHEDSLLMRIMRNKSWNTLFYKAHKAFDDFSELLWPEQWNEESLRAERQTYIDDGYSEGYAQEYLNDPTAHGEAYFRKEDFKELEEEMKVLYTLNYAAVDLAISDADKAAYTVIVVGGVDPFRRIHIKHVLRFRGDSNDILDAFFEIQAQYNIQLWKIEEGQIKRTLMGELYNRMNSRGSYLTVSPGIPSKDKRGRARAIQARMRAGGVYFDKTAPWYPALEHEMLSFPKGMYKDQVDAIAWLGIAINELSEGPTKEEKDEEDYEEAKMMFGTDRSGQSPVCGY